ncbi:MAG: hypothetical protein MHMPM18_000045 [Marteilia pararefringens]
MDPSQIFSSKMEVKMTMKRIVKKSKELTGRIKKIKPLIDQHPNPVAIIENEFTVRKISVIAVNNILKNASHLNILNYCFNKILDILTEMYQFTEEHHGELKSMSESSDTFHKISIMTGKFHHRVQESKSLISSIYHKDFLSGISKPEARSIWKSCFSDERGVNYYVEKSKYLDFLKQMFPITSKYEPLNKLAERSSFTGNECISLYEFNFLTILCYNLVYIPTVLMEVMGSSYFMPNITYAAANALLIAEDRGVFFLRLSYSEIKWVVCYVDKNNNFIQQKISYSLPREMEQLLLDGTITYCYGDRTKLDPTPLFKNFSPSIFEVGDCKYAVLSGNDESFTCKFCAKGNALEVRLEPCCYMICMACFELLQFAKINTCPDCKDKFQSFSYIQLVKVDNEAQCNDDYAAISDYVNIEAKNYKSNAINSGKVSHHNSEEVIKLLGIILSAQNSAKDVVMNDIKVRRIADSYMRHKKKAQITSGSLANPSQSFPYNSPQTTNINQNDIYDGFDGGFAESNKRSLLNKSASYEPFGDSKTKIDQKFSTEPDPTNLEIYGEFPAQENYGDQSAYQNFNDNFPRQAANQDIYGTPGDFDSNSFQKLDNFGDEKTLKPNSMERLDIYGTFSALGVIDKSKSVHRPDAITNQRLHNNASNSQPIYDIYDDKPTNNSENLSKIHDSQATVRIIPNDTTVYGSLNDINVGEKALKNTNTQDRDIYGTFDDLRDIGPTKPEIMKRVKPSYPDYNGESNIYSKINPKNDKNTHSKRLYGSFDDISQEIENSRAINSVSNGKLQNEVVYDTFDNIAQKNNAPNNQEPSAPNNQAVYGTFDSVLDRTTSPAGSNSVKEGINASEGSQDTIYDAIEDKEENYTSKIQLPSSMNTKFPEDSPVGHGGIIIRKRSDSTKGANYANENEIYDTNDMTYKSKEDSQIYDYEDNQYDINNNGRNEVSEQQKSSKVIPPQRKRSICTILNDMHPIIKFHI